MRNQKKTKWELLRQINYLRAPLEKARESLHTIFCGKAKGYTLSERKEERGVIPRENEALYKALVENANDIIYRTNVEGYFIYVNPVAVRIVGYTEKELIGKHYLELVRPDYHSTIQQFYLKQFQEKISSTYFEFPAITKDRREVWLGQNVQLIMEGNWIYGFQAVARDISERRRAEHALRESEERFRFLVEDIGDAFYVHDLDGKIMEVNKRTCESLGYTRDELLQLSVMDIIDVYWNGNPFREGLKQLSLGVPVTGEGIHRRKDGTTFPVEVRLVKVQYNGREFIISLARDITERKRTERALRESEEKYRTLFEESTDGIAISTPQGKFIDINPAGVKLLGYSSKEELLQVDIPKDLYVNPSDRTRLHCALESKGHLKDFEVELKRKDGIRVIVRATINIIHDENGRPIGYRNMFTDVTERKKLEQRLLQTQKMEAIGTLAGGIAHDFNNILAAIIGYTEMAMDPLPEGHQSRADLEHVMKAANRAKELVKQILVFSRQVEQPRKPVQIQLIVREALKLLRASLPVTIEICQHIDPQCPPVLADPGQIHQVLMNLCTNAFHAMRKNGGVLDVSLNTVEIEDQFVRKHPNMHIGTYVRLTVSDTGSGIDKKIISRIYEPFFTTKSVGEGTGLGLSVVHGIVTSHGGEITVYSEPGRGTTFHVFLPRVNNEIKPEVRHDDPIPRGTERVLFVDDEEEIAVMGKRMLQKLGYIVTTRTSSVEALAAFRADPYRFDIVITDQTMPNMTGIQFAKNLLDIRPGLPIILTTGFSEAVTPQNFKKLGIRDYIMKPVVARELSTAIQRALNKELEQEE